MKNIILYEDDNRTLIFQSDDWDKIQEWFKATLEDITSKGGKIYSQSLDLAWGTFEDETAWKIVIYRNWEVPELRKVTI